MSANRKSDQRTAADGADSHAHRKPGQASGRHCESHLSPAILPSRSSLTPETRHLTPALLPSAYWSAGASGTGSWTGTFQKPGFGVYTYT
jgi:hypothetical protein